MSWLVKMGEVRIWSRNSIWYPHGMWKEISTIFSCVQLVLFGLRFCLCKFRIGVEWKISYLYTLRCNIKLCESKQVDSSEHYAQILFVIIFGIWIWTRVAYWIREQFLRSIWQKNLLYFFNLLSFLFNIIYYL